MHKDRIHGEIHKNQSGTRMNQNKMNGRRDCAVALFCSIFKEGAWSMFSVVQTSDKDKEYMNKKKVRNNSKNNTACCHKFEREIISLFDNI